MEIGGHVTVMYLRFIRNTYFYEIKQKKLKITVLVFFQARKLLQ